MINQASVVSEIFILEELEELNYKTMPYMKRKVQGHQIQKGIAIANPRLQPIDSKKVVLQDEVREVVTRQGLGE